MRKGFSISSPIIFVAIIGMLAIVYAFLYWYLIFNARTELFSDISKIYEYTVFSTTVKETIRTSAIFSFKESISAVANGNIQKLSDEQMQRAIEEKFKEIFSKYMDEFHSSERRLSGTPKLESAIFNVTEDKIFLNFSSPIRLGRDDLYVFISPEIVCDKCISISSESMNIFS